MQEALNPIIAVSLCFKALKEVYRTMNALNLFLSPIKNNAPQGSVFFSPSLFTLLSCHLLQLRYQRTRCLYFFFFVAFQNVLLRQKRQLMKIYNKLFFSYIIDRSYYQHFCQMAGFSFLKKSHGVRLFFFFQQEGTFVEHLGVLSPAFSAI